MKKANLKLLFIIILISVMPIVVIAGGTEDPPTQPDLGANITNDFTDINFLAWIRYALGLEEEDDIYEYHIKQWEEDNHDITIEPPDDDDTIIKFLDGIEHFTNIELLDIQGHNINNLDLSYNIKLTRLIAINNNITTIILPNSQYLYHVDLSNNSLTDIDISYNLALSYLNLNGNEELTEGDIQGLPLSALQHVEDLLFESPLEEFDDGMDDLINYVRDLFPVDPPDDRYTTYIHINIVFEWDEEEEEWRIVDMTTTDEPDDTQPQGNPPENHDSNGRSLIAWILVIAVFVAFALNLLMFALKKE